MASTVKRAVFPYVVPGWFPMIVSIQVYLPPFPFPLPTHMNTRTRTLHLPDMLDQMKEGKQTALDANININDNTC